MTDDEIEAQNNNQRLRELVDRMFEAGFVERPVNLGESSATILTPKGVSLHKAIKEFVDSIAPLTNQDILLLWALFKMGKVVNAAGDPVV